MTRPTTTALLISGLLLVGASSLPAEPAPGGNAPAAQPGSGAALPANAPIDTILDALDQRGKTLKDFSADVQMSTEDPAIGNTNTRLGKVYFQKKGNERDARLHIVLDKQVKKNGASLMMVPNKLEYLLDEGKDLGLPPGVWLIDRDYPKTTEITRQVVKPGDKVNLLKLGEGPFPLPIGQSKQDVHANFDVSKIDPAKSDPPNTSHVRLKPKDGTKLAKRFDQIDVWVDRNSQMPVRIDTQAAGGGEQRETVLSNVVVNPPGGLPPADFQLQQIPASQWNRHTEEYQG